MKVEFDYISEFYSVYPAGGARFVRNAGGGNGSAFDVWDGYLDPIMKALWKLCFERQSISYLPLLQEWNECTGYKDPYNEKEYTFVRELALTIAALQTIDPSNLTEYRGSPGEVAQVLRDLILFLNSAAILGQTVTISEL